MIAIGKGVNNAMSKRFLYILKSYLPQDKYSKDIANDQFNVTTLAT